MYSMLGSQPRRESCSTSGLVCLAVAISRLRHELAGFQREHPGVTVMAAGALGFLQKLPDYPALAPGQFTWEVEHIEGWLEANSTISPLAMMTAGRWWIVLGVALTIALGFLPLRRLFGTGPAILATLFVAWDPFAIGFSRQLHPDGFVAGFTYLALLLFLSWLYTGRRRRDLIASGPVSYTHLALPTISPF